MKNLGKRIIAFVFALVILFFSCVPSSHAAEVELGFDMTNSDYWSWWFDNVRSNITHPFMSFFDKDVCPRSPDTNSRHNFKEQRTTVDGKTGLFYICEYCGKSAGEVGKTAYDGQVSEMPVTGYSSDGSILYSPKHYAYILYGDHGNGALFLDCGHRVPPNAPCPELATCYFDCAHNVFSIYPPSGEDLFVLGEIYIAFMIEAPISGTYERIETPVARGSMKDISDDEVINLFVPNYTSEKKFYNAGDSEKLVTTLSIAASGLSEAILYCDPPVYKVTPAETFDKSVYDVTSRPTSITGGNYGIVGDDGTINTVTNNNQIINETNNTYYNPATGETSTITDWQYNYEDRSYTVTMESGDTATVTYGDENISITENNVVEGSTTVNNYTIYYMVENPVDPAPSDSPSPSPSVSPTPSACPHTWTETSRQNPTCTVPGSVSYRCSQCNETKTETLKAKGHTWQVERTVQTTYDEQGNLLQQGYTIYKCSVCGEQYKDETGVGPPGGDSPIDSPIDEDKFKSVIDLVMSIFEELPKLFNRFLDFLSEVFPYLPPELTLLLTFGVVAVVFIGIIKAIRR